MGLALELPLLNVVLSSRPSMLPPPSTTEQLPTPPHRPGEPIECIEKLPPRKNNTERITVVADTQAAPNTGLHDCWCCLLSAPFSGKPYYANNR